MLVLWLFSMKAQLIKILVIFSYLLIFQPLEIASQVSVLDSLYTESQYFSLLDSSDEETFTREFEYPFLTILDEAARRRYQSLSSLEARKAFMKLYWRMSNPNPLLPENPWLMKFIERCRYVRKHFAYSKPPYFDDRGKYYLKFGEPSARYVDKGGRQFVNIFLDDAVYGIIYRIYNGFPPNKYFSVLPNETWAYQHISNDFVVYFVAEGSYFEEVNSLIKALDTRISKNSSWYWGELIKKRRAVSPIIANTVEEIESIEERLKISAAIDNMETNPMARLNFIRDLSTIATRKFTELSIKESIAKDYARRDLSVLYYDLNKSFSQVEFTTEIAQFRGPGGLTRLELLFFTPIEENFPKSVRDTLALEYSGLLRDRAYNRLMENHRTVHYSVRQAVEAGVATSVGTLHLVARAQPVELTVQVKEVESGKLGFNKLSLELRDYTGRELQLSDLLLFREIGGEREVGLLPLFAIENFQLTPVLATRVSRQVPLFCYFEVYNLKAVGVKEYDLRVEVTSRGKGRSLFKKLGSWLSGAKDVTLGLEHRRLVDADTGRELLSLDLSHLKEGAYTLRVTVTAGEKKAVAERLIRVVE